MDRRQKVIKGLEQFKADFKPFCGNGSDWARVDDAINLLKEQAEQIERLEYALAVTQNNLNYYVNGND